MHCRDRYIYLTKTALDVFRCTMQDSGESFLDADPSIPCKGPEYLLMQKAAALFLLLYSFGIPIALTWSEGAQTTHKLCKHGGINAHQIVVDP